PAALDPAPPRPRHRGRGRAGAGGRPAAGRGGRAARPQPRRRHTPRAARGAGAAPLPARVVERPDATPADVPAIALSEALVRARALDAGLAYELVAARYDLAQVVAAVRRSQAERPGRA